MNKKVNKQRGAYMDEEIDDMVSSYFEAMKPVIQGKGKVPYIPALEGVVTKMSLEYFCL
jgi:hypothetical protein